MFSCKNAITSLGEKLLYICGVHRELLTYFHSPRPNNASKSACNNVNFELEKKGGIKSKPLLQTRKRKAKHCN